MPRIEICDHGSTQKLYWIVHIIQTYYHAKYDMSNVKIQTKN